MPLGKYSIMSRDWHFIDHELQEVPSHPATHKLFSPSLPGQSTMEFKTATSGQDRLCPPASFSTGPDGLIRLRGCSDPWTPWMSRDASSFPTPHNQHRTLLESPTGLTEAIQVRILDTRIGNPADIA